MVQQRQPVKTRPVSVALVAWEPHTQRNQSVPRASLALITAVSHPTKVEVEKRDFVSVHP